MKFSRETICEILSHCATKELTLVVDKLLEVGAVLGDALVTVAEVAVGSSLGWAMRMGNDPHGAVAAAILDGWVAQSVPETDAPHLAILEELLEATVLQESAERSLKTTQVLSTAIEFEELD